MNTLKSKFFWILSFLNLTDRGYKLSISNIAVIVVITKIALAQNVGLTEAGALLITLMNYSHKRFESNKAIKEEAKNSLSKDKSAQEVSVESSIKQVQEQVSSLVSSISNLKSFEPTLEGLKVQVEQYSKVAEEAKSLLTANQVSKAFGARKSQL